MTVEALSRVTSQAYTGDTLCLLGRRFGGPTGTGMEPDFYRLRIVDLPHVRKGEARRCYQHATGLWRPIKEYLKERMTSLYWASCGLVSAYA